MLFDTEGSVGINEDYALCVALSVCFPQVLRTHTAYPRVSVVYKDINSPCSGLPKH